MTSAIVPQYRTKRVYEITAPEGSRQLRLSDPDRTRRAGVRLVPEGGCLAAERARPGRTLPRARDGRGQGAEVHRRAGEVGPALPRRRSAEDDDRHRVPPPVRGGARDCRTDKPPSVQPTRPP